MTSSIPATTKQFEYTQYGPVDQVWKLNTHASLKALAPTHVRIKVAFAALNKIDYFFAEGGIRQFGEPSEQAPFVVGFDAAGTVVEVGADVTDFKVGDDVYTCTPIDNFGTVAEFISVDAQYVARKPTNLSFQDAAGIPLAAITSYQALVVHAKLQRGERVLLLGGSSGTGTYGIQLAKGIGASVVATAGTRNIDLVKSLGAESVIDYTQQHWADVLEPHSFDVIYDCGFEPQSWNGAAQRILKRDTGRFVTISPVIADPIQSPIGATCSALYCVASGKYLTEITGFVERGYVKTVVDSVFPLEGLLDAIAKVKDGHVVGKVIVAVA